jgi:hypothetical protein
MTSLGTLDAAAAELAHVPWDDLGGSDALAVTLALGKLKAVVEGALVAVADRLEATGAAEAVGWASTKDFLTHVLGGRKGTGGGIVRVAERTRDLPAVREALVAGAISLAQAGVISRRVTTLPRVPELRDAAADKMLTRIAERGLDATDLDQCFPDVVRELDPDGKLLGSELSKEREERGAHQSRHLSLTPDTLGGVWIKAYGTPEDVEILKNTLMPLAAPVTTEPGACGGDPDNISNRDPQTGRRISAGCPTIGSGTSCAHDGKDPRDHGVRMWDALIEACRRLQATDTLPQAHGTTARMTVTMSLEDLRAQLERDGLLPSGERISAAAARRLACDAEIIPAVLGSNSQVLDVGRTQRLVTVGIWNALVLRDRHCAFPGCNRLPIACDAHHIVHWADGGSTSLGNLILLCRKHHTTVHRTPWTVKIDPETGRPVWTPPPLIDDTDRFSYSPARPKPPPLVA